jgi:hypothetical protein
MSIWTGVRDWLNERHSSTDARDLAHGVTQFNPATGLPIYGGVDILGNPPGLDLSSYHHSHYDHDAHRTSAWGDTPIAPPIVSYDPDRGW